LPGGARLVPSFNRNFNAIGDQLAFVFFGHLSARMGTRGETRKQNKCGSQMTHNGSPFIVFEPYLTLIGCSYMAGNAIKENNTAWSEPQIF
jgi:hypothetical protein